MNNRLDIKNSFDGNLKYGAKDFNLLTGRDVHLKNRNQLVIPNYYSEKTGNIKSSFIKKRRCPLCNNNDKRFLFNKSGFDHVKCNNCDLVYVNPILKEEKLHSFYLDEDSYNNVLTNELQISLDRKRFNYNLDIIEEYTGKPGQLLDIGAGPGTFVEVANERGWEPVAIEFNTFCVERIRSLGIECYDKAIEDVDFSKNSFDCITLWAVLEHIIHPQDLLKKINYLLKPGGILAILVPNIESLCARIMHEKCATFSGDTHINFFSNKTLTKIQEMNGFTVLESETLFSEVNTIKNYLNYSDPYIGDSEQEFVFLDPKFIHDNLLGYTLVTYSKKK